MGDVYGAPGELNRALMDGNLPIQGQGAIPAAQAQQQLGGLKTINQRGFAEGTGKKKALFIGINYFGTEAQLSGCINDVRNMWVVLVLVLGRQRLYLISHSSTRLSHLF